MGVFLPSLIIHCASQQDSNEDMPRPTFAYRFQLVGTSRTPQTKGARSETRTGTPREQSLTSSLRCYVGHCPAQIKRERPLCTIKGETVVWDLRHVRYRK